MHLKSINLLKIILITLLVSACGCQVLPPNQAMTTENPKEAWARVLAAYVDSQGRVDFAGIRKQPADLDTWVAYIARVSPRSHPEHFPSKAVQLAYYIDAYNGLALYGVLHSGVEPAQNIRFFLLRRYLIGGESMSLYKLENTIIRPMGKPRVHFALNCMSASCPRLPQTPWSAQHLEAQLETATKTFFNTSRHLQVDAINRTAHLSEILDFYEDDFLSQAPTLLDYVNRYRETKIPADFEVQFIPYDWSLNRQP